MSKLLLVEDNKTIIKGLEYSLKQEGFEVSVEMSVKDTKENILHHKYDLIILDISLPDGDGFELCSYIKQQGDTPIIFLTAREEESNVVLGLDMGADDYIIKPFRVKELISRINSVIRRYEKTQGKQSIIQVKDVILDTNKGTVYKNNQEVILTSLEYKILLMLFNNQGQLISREQILDKIWDIAGNFVNDNTLTVYIKRIREKIEDDSNHPEIIKTIRGLGYKVGD